MAMENTMLIELTNHKAIKLLRDLEELKLIKVLKENVAQPKKLSDKYRGSISKEDGESLLKHIEESRNGWDSI
jgi:hypothetical protein